MVDSASCYHAGACHGRQLSNGKGMFNVPIKRRCGQGAVGGCGRVLAAGHAVDTVVNHYSGEIQVPSRGMDEMVPADRRSIAITHDHDDLQFGVGKLYACGKGQGPAVSGMKGVEIYVYGNSSRAANS